MENSTRDLDDWIDRFTVAIGLCTHLDVFQRGKNKWKCMSWWGI